MTKGKGVVCNTSRLSSHFLKESTMAYLRSYNNDIYFTMKVIFSDIVQ